MHEKNFNKILNLDPKTKNTSGIFIHFCDMGSLREASTMTLHTAAWKSAQCKFILNQGILVTSSMLLDCLLYTRTCI